MLLISLFSQMCLVGNCEASGNQDAVPARTKPKEDDIPTNLWCDLSKYSNSLSAYFNEQPFTLHARGPNGKQVQCPLDITTLDKAAALPIATSTTATNLRQ